jgi:HSP20 family protein
MDLVRWDPFREMVSLRDAMDRLVEGSFVGMPMRRREGPEALALDVYETDSDLKVEASLPGFKPGDVDISVVGNTLNIKAETEREEEKKEGRYHYRERYYGSFQRSIPLSVDVDGNKAEATFEDGVLKLTMPKVEEAKPKRIEVKSKK